LKRLFDIFFSFFGLVFFAPILIPVIILIWIQDFKNPFYIAPRVGLNGKLFKMIKLRSMIINADSSGVDSTSNNDTRITIVGKFIRKFKLDELSQIYNVLIGDMSFVGPRPNVKNETDLYTNEEKVLITVKPGITDFSSIVFSDEGEILSNSVDPNIDYNQLIRPGKSMLGIFYVNNNNLILDIKLIFLTILSIFSKKKALKFITKILEKKNANKNLIKIASRKYKLERIPPPGSKKIVTNRNI